MHDMDILRMVLRMLPLCIRHAAQQIAALMHQHINAEEPVAMIVGVETQEEFEVLIDDRNDSLLESHGCFSKGVGELL